MSVEFLVYNVLRVFAACVVIPLWLIIGFCTFGMLWPPQVREKLLAGQMTTQTEQASAEQDRLKQLKALMGDVSSFQEEVQGDMDKGRDELYVIKTVLDTTKTELHTEMNDVKQVVTELFEMLTAGR